MHILFVENRYTTFLLDSIAKYLFADGHKISWLVQNHMFKPRSSGYISNINTIPYPMGKGSVSSSSTVNDDGKKINFSKVIPADRGVDYFGCESGHYTHYYDSIANIIESEDIDIVFGETTLFHELITEYLCGQKDIPYLHPVATRIPSGRLQFFKGRTMTSIGGCKMPPILKDLAIENNVLSTREKVAFMNTRPVKKGLGEILTLFAVRFKVVMGRVLGEKYNTPSLIRKFRLERNLKAKKIEFIEIVKCPQIGYGKYLLYPLQMQPETNIDIWSAGNGCQTKIIKELSEKLVQTDFRLLVKFNPHAKYELLDENLLALAGQVDFLPFEFDMSEALKMSDAVISVTGSIILECISMRKPIFVVGSHEMSRLPGVNQLVSTGDIAKYIGHGLANHVTPTEKDGIDYLEQLYMNSYPGTWFDPINMNEFATDQNISDIVSAFRDIIELVENKG